MFQEKKYPMSSIRAEQLRSQGKLPISNDVLSFAAVLGLILSIFFAFNSLPESIFDYSFDIKRDICVSKNTSLIDCFDFTILSKGLFLSCALVFSVVFPIFVVGFLQNSFYFSFEAFKLSKRQRVEVEGDVFLRIGLAFLVLLKSAVVVLLLIYFWNALFVISTEEYFLSALSQVGEISGRRLIEDYLSKFMGGMSAPNMRSINLKSVVLAVLFLNFIIAVFSKLLAALLFNFRYRMTRAEVLAEQRENEPREEFKQIRHRGE